MRQLILIKVCYFVNGTECFKLIDFELNLLSDVIESLNQVCPSRVLIPNEIKINKFTPIGTVLFKPRASCGESQSKVN